MENAPAKSNGSSPFGAVLTLFGLIMLGLVVVSIAYGLLNRFGKPSESNAGVHQAVGLPLPGLRLQPIDDLEISVDLEELQGKVLLINFWGTWCPPCRDELPHMDELYLANRSNEMFRMLTVSCGNGPENDPQQLADDTAGYLKHFDYQVPAYLDENSATREMLYADPRYLPDFAYPTTLVVDQQGMIRGVWIGYRPGYEEEMASLVAELTAETS